MFEFYRKKGKKGLCYRVVAWTVQPFFEKAGVRFNEQREPLVVIQHQQGSCYSMTESKFWEMFEGVEDEDIPPAYRKAR